MRVAIIGCGVAGIRSAMLLREHGIEFEIFEARNRAGGRVHTPDGVYDSGGEWIDSNHRRVLSLLKERGVTPEPSLQNLYRINFQGDFCDEADLWEDASADFQRVEFEAEKIAAELDVLPWKNSSKSILDSRTLAEFIDSFATSPRGKWWTRAYFRSDEGDDAENIGLLGWLCGFRHYLMRDASGMSSFRVPGGMGKFFQELAVTSADSTHFGAELLAVSQSDASVDLEFTASHATFDSVILTLPPRCIEKIRFSPELPSDQTAAIAKCRMSPVVKVAMEFSSAWWEQCGWSGYLFTDSPLQQVWVASRTEVPILCAYVCGKDALKLIKQNNPVESALKMLAELFPQAKEHFVRGHFHDWVTDDFSRGGFSSYAPGYVLRHREHIAKPHGNVFFAGEHTALWTGFIEGALESAEVAVKALFTQR